MPCPLLGAVAVNQGCCGRIFRSFIPNTRIAFGRACDPQAISPLCITELSAQCKRGIDLAVRGLRLTLAVEFAMKRWLPLLLFLMAAWASGYAPEPGGLFLILPGDLTNITDSASNQSGLFYNLVGEKVAMADPDMGYWQWALDATGRPKVQTDAKQQQIRMFYNDPAG